MAAHRNSRRRPRRGIVLLIVISLLVLFMLILVTFAVVSGSYRDASQAFAYRKALLVKFDENTAVMDEVLNMLLAEPASQTSSLWGHGLLTDLYGESVNGVIAGNAATEPGLPPAYYFYRFDAIRDTQQTFPYAFFSNTQSYHVGCVLTMKDGPCAGLSTRITHYSPSNPNAAITINPADPTTFPPAMGPYLNATHLTGASDPVSFRVEAFENGLWPQPGNHFVVNGKPFSGTGVGRPYPLNSTTGLLDVSGNTNWYSNDAVGETGPTLAGTSQSVPWALVPHLARWRHRLNAQRSLYGGANEPWDAFDYQNMYLTLAASTPGPLIYPAFHRPDLLNYWINYYQTLGQNLLDGQPDHVEFLRKIVFRPLGADNPLFTGSNPLFEQDPSGATSGNLTWDVDNDNDGIPDSIWIDVGLPIQSGPDGRKFRPLVALMIKDQDSLINVNAHGTPEWYKVENRSDTQMIGNLAGNTPGTPVIVPRGLGVGPAEIQWASLFPPEDDNNDGSISAAEVQFARDLYQRVLQGEAGTSPRLGRYGLDGSPNQFNRRPGFPGASYNATISPPTIPPAPSNDPLSVIKTQGFGLAYDNSYFPPALYYTASNYASPSDVWGRGALALDYAGQPYSAVSAAPPYPVYLQQSFAKPTDWDGTATNVTPEINDNPYEINLVDFYTNNDTPYTVADLESVLRRHDADQPQLPQRLNEFLKPISTPSNLPSPSYARRSKLVSTISSSINTPRGSIPRWMRDPSSPNYMGQDSVLRLPVPSSILDIALARIRNTNPGNTESAYQTVLGQVMPFELFHGQLFDLNRPFGNGVDDNGNGVVDESGEADNINGPAEPAWTAGLFAGPYPSPQASAAIVLNDADSNWWTQQAPNAASYLAPANYLQQDPHLYARQLYARHLYCLLLLMVDPQFTGAYPRPDTAIGTSVTPQQLLCRQLAQFAVNAVDYRDPDAIMTPFEYDLNPWDGWNVDGYLPSNEDENLPAGNPPRRGVVWGMEYPDLQLTESMAFHNRRVKDTAHDNGVGDGDNKPGKKRMEDVTLDQYGIPEGSLFLELFCARNSTANNAKVPTELYDASGALDIGRVAPARAFGMATARHPVWRAVVTANPTDPASGNPTPIYSYDGTYPYSGVFEPRALNTPIQRVIWFSPNDPANTPEQDMVFFERTKTLAGLPNGQLASSALVAPGQYLVAAPRADTRIGALAGGTDGDPNTYEQSPLQFTVAGGLFTTAGGVANNGFTPYPQSGATIAPVVGLTCAAKPPAAWGDQTQQIGMNISEPMPTATYYPEPTVGPLTPRTNYVDLSMPWATGTNECPDKPFDDDPAYGGPMSKDTTNGVRTGTREDFNSIFLQRVANPLFAWNPMPDDPQFGSSFDPTLPINPYVTIDWTTLDLTVYSGDENTALVVDDSDPNPFTTDPPEKFAGRERGRPIGGNPDLRFWRNWVRDLPLTDVDTMDADHYFHRKPDHTLGYLNSTMGVPVSPPPAPGYAGFPNGGFPWLTWNNRPFANAAELLMVPASMPERLGVEFGFGNTVDPTQTPYVVGGGFNSSNEWYAGFYGHLLPFFPTTDYVNAIRYGDFHRLFDYVETPSLFVGTEDWLPPAITNDTSGTNPGSGYRAPFNRVSRFRDPGRININTVSDEMVWNAIMANFPDMQTTNANPQSLALASTFYALLQSRRGYALSGGETPNAASMYATNPAYPSIVSNPFRPADAFDLMPLQTMKLSRPVDATLLRGTGAPLPASGSGPPTPGQFPLLNNGVYNATFDPAAVPFLYEATDRNAYFRHLAYTKLANMVTTNSNTFAVWMTVGYFEVTPNPAGVDTAHPDGWQLGQEMLFDGVVRRPRAFFLIDRSIPVGFEPGKALNVDKCVLQRRYMD